MADEASTQALGPNAWLVDEMYERYRDDPTSVSESWQDFFADYRRHDGAEEANGKSAKTPTAERTVADTPHDETARQPDTIVEAGDEKAERRQQADAADDDPGDPLRGAAARIVSNMEASLGVPTATSFREVPAKLLEVNRRVINGYLARTGGGKISFTHLIGYAVVRAIADAVPAMNNSFAEAADGKPRIVHNRHVSLGLAVDVEKKGGGRTLLVPVINDADTLDFRGFWSAYEDLIRKVRTNKLTPDDFAGATVSLTNPGTIGTVQSVPRLMPGQGLIVGVGSARLPGHLPGRRPRDAGPARPVQGHDGQLHLRPPHHPGRRVGPVPEARADLLMGEDDFYVEVFRSLGVPYERSGGGATTTRSTRRRPGSRSRCRWPAS